MKKIFFTLIILGLILIIFLLTKEKKIYFFSISDTKEGKIIVNELEKYLKSKGIYQDRNVYIKDYLRTTDLIRDIENNIELEGNIKIKNALVKSDLITISIGKYDYSNYFEDLTLLNNEIINLKEDMQNLFETIRKITKEKIIFIGIYNPYPENVKIKKILKELNDMYKNLAAEYNIYYIDIYTELENNVYNKKINNEGYEYIIDKLIKVFYNDIID